MDTGRAAVVLLGILISGVIAWDVGATNQPVMPREVRFKAPDGATLYADVYADGSTSVSAPVILLFHQGGGDARGEYGPIIPRLLDRGFNVIAVDLAGGGDRFGTNRTVASRSAERTSYCDELTDLEASLELARIENLTGPVILWGSSYSASLAIRLAAEHQEGVAAVLAFSPAGGGPMESCRPDPWVSRLIVPLLVLRPASELANPSVVEQMAMFRKAGHSTWEATDGAHGSSMLVAERVAGDPEPTWTRVLEFIDESLGSETENAGLERRVRAFSQSLTVGGGGPDVYASFLHPSFTRWSHGQGDIERREAFLASVREWWDYGMRVSAGESRIAGIDIDNDLAIVRVERSERFVDAKGADAGRFHGFVTQIWSRAGGRWMLIGLDVSRAPE